MDDWDKSKDQLIEELIGQRQRATELEARLWSVADYSPNMVFINAGGRVVYANQRCTELTGYTIEEFCAPDFDFITLIAPEYRERVRASFDQHIAGQDVEPYEYALIGKDGRRIETILTSRLLDFYGQPAILGMITDVTEYKRASHLLRAQRDLGIALSAARGVEETLRLCLETAIRISTMDSGGIYLVDAISGEVHLVVHQGLATESIAGASHYDADSPNARAVRAGVPIYTQGDRSATRALEFARREGLGALAIIPVRHEGRPIACLNLASHSLDEVPDFARTALETIATQIGSAIVRSKAEDALVGYSERLEEMVQERTRELEEAQKELVRREQFAVLGQLAGNVAHELRNPLGAIKNAAYFLNMVLDEVDPEVSESLLILDKEVANSERIISKLLGVAQATPPTPLPVDLNGVINGALERATVPEEVTLVRQLAASLPIIQADPDQLAQVLDNILLNGIQAMDTGGRLTVRSELESDGWLAVSISDTGAGIPEDHLERVFEPLFTTKAKGIGLGLALVRALVENHGGTVWVTSTVGEGSTFTVRLPVED